MNVGQEGVFFLRANPANDFATLLEYSLPLEKANSNFESERKAVLRMLNIYADPQTALLADKAIDRQFAACALVMRYRAALQHADPTALASALIPADESKLILKALSDMKWGETPFDVNGTLSLQNVFWQLQLTDKDGWKQPAPKENEDQNEALGKAVSKWLNENSEKYRIQRVVMRSTKPN